MSALTEQDIQNIRIALKRCNPETQEAAIRFRTTGDTGALPVLVYGIIERHLAPESHRNLSEAGDDTRLVEDLGVDSLSLLEIVLTIEETIGISIENEELREIRTLGEVKTFIEHKITHAKEGKGGPRIVTQHFDRLAIGMRIPQQPPFFFLDEAEIEGDTVRAKYLIRGDEYFLEGHFKDNPVMPASIVFEAVGQAACLWVLEYAPVALGMDLKSNEVLFASMEDAHFYRRAKPGDLLEMEATKTQVHAPLAVFRGTVRLRGERLAQIEHLVLAFGPDAAEHLDKKAMPAVEEVTAVAVTGEDVVTEPAGEQEQAMLPLKASNGEAETAPAVKETRPARKKTPAKPKPTAARKKEHKAVNGFKPTPPRKKAVATAAAAAPAKSRRKA